ncbi:MAG: hypothetical protein KBT39_02580 [Bacteroidales bacterium]|nr:hypothetical protein [Bacteroidales bacterium]
MKWKVIGGVVAAAVVFNLIDKCIHMWDDPTDKFSVQYRELKDNVKRLKSDESAKNLRVVLENIDEINQEKEHYYGAAREEYNDHKEEFEAFLCETEETVEKCLKNIPVSIVDAQDTLISKRAVFPFYAKRGENMKCQVNLQHASSVRIYNADSRQVVKDYGRTTRVNEVLEIKHSAIYLVDIANDQQQYADVAAHLYVADGIRFASPEEVETTSETVSSHDPDAQRIDGVEMRSLFEEPRKFTLRGQLKASFSGASRAIVAIKVPRGVKDVLYSLRISTNEYNHNEDGKFCENMTTSYHKVKFLGLPLYESQHGTGLFSTLLGLNLPEREGDAYINMYVFYDEGQARKFQNGEDPTKLKYNLDYSTLGTQSCNGRIPTNGHSTIYMGYENERIRYNNYVWLEALTAVPKTEYCRPVYRIKKEDKEIY